MSTTQLGEMRAPEFRPGINNTVAAIGQYLCVKQVAAEVPYGVELCAAQTDIPCGFTVRGGIPASGAHGDLAIRGQVRVTASGAISPGARIAPDANGKVTAAGAGDTVIGRALDEALADGDIILAEVDCVAVVIL